MNDVLQFWIAIISFVTVGVLGFWYLRSSIVKARQGELAGLVEARGERIGDLEAQVGRLETRLAQLEGQFQALQALKAEEIALEVSRLLGDPLNRILSNWELLKQGGLLDPT